MVAGPEGDLVAAERKVAEVVEADGQVAVLTTEREGGVCGNM